MSDVFGISDLSQGGPGAPPQPWIVGNNAVAYNGALLVPSTVLGNTVTPPGTINTNDLYIKGTPIEVILESGYLQLTGGALTGLLSIPGIAELNIHDGQAGQFISSNGDGTLTWRNIVGVGLPGGGTDGQVLATDGNVNFYWTSLLPGGPYVTVASGPYLQLAGGTLTGVLNISGAAGTARVIRGQTGALNRWELRLGGNAAESGSNAGSDFAIVPYADAGTALPTALSINRATGNVSLNGSLTLASAGGGLLINGAVGIGRNIFGQTAGLARWALQLGGGGAESGSNAGSDFALYRYTDAGAVIDTPLTISRASAAFTFTGSGQVNGNFNVSGAIGANGTLTSNSSMSIKTTLSIAETAVNANGYVGFFTANFAARKGYVGLVSENIILNADGQSSLTLSTTANSASFSGNLTVGGALQVNATLGVSSSASIAGGLTTGAITCNGQFYAPNQNVLAGNAVYYCYNVNSGAYLNAYTHSYSSGWYWTWNSSNGQLTWVGGNNGVFSIQGNGVVTCSRVSFGSNGFSFAWGGYVVLYVDGGAQGNVVISNVGGWAAIQNLAASGTTGGMWFSGGNLVWACTPSDRRLKSNIKNATKDALQLICSIPVHELDMTLPMKGSKPRHWNWSLIADEIQELIPIAYIEPPPEHPVEPETPSYASIDQLPLVAALIKAVQQLTEKVQFLESKLA
jgi:cytoskeletal protein CcmA (bactofilin family)